MDNHTKGPWIANGRYVGVPNHRSMIAECRDNNHNWANDEMSLANARVISAAPDLLDCAKEFVRVMQSMELSLGDPLGQAFLAAIAKAEGRSWSAIAQ